MDTLRADHLGVYGYTIPTSPNLDALAAESFVFDDARAQAPCTFPSVNSILTGRFPTHFVGQPGNKLGIPKFIPSMAEVLAASEYATAAVSASPIVRRSPSDQNPHGGFGRGFDYFDESCLWDDAGCINRQTRSLVDMLSEPFFLYLHYLDPHDPYSPPAEWPRRLPASEEEKSSLLPSIAAGDPNPIAQALYGSNDASLATPEALARLRALYDEEIAYVDSQVGDLVRYLRDRGLLDRSILVFLSDHGEEFFEHRHMKHCRTLFDTELRTPFFIRLPPNLTVSEPGRVTTQVANLDVVPTILDYLRIPAQPLGLEGVSLRPLLERSEDELSSDRPPVFAGWGGLRAVKDGQFKLIYRLGNGAMMLYDLDEDQAERTNLAGTDPDVARQLLAKLSEWRTRVESGKESLEEDEAVKERLRSLGYLE